MFFVLNDDYHFLGTIPVKKMKRKQNERNFEKLQEQQTIHSILIGAAMSIGVFS